MSRMRRRRGPRILCVLVAGIVLAATAQASGVRRARSATATISRAHLASLLRAGTRAAARDDVNFAEVLGIAAPGAGEMLRVNSAWSTPRHIEASAIDFSSGLLRSDAKADRSISVQTVVRGDTSYIRAATPTGKWTRQHVTPTSVSTAGLAGRLLSLSTRNGVVRTSTGRTRSAYRISLRTNELGLLTAFAAQLPARALTSTSAADRRLLAGLTISIPDLVITLDRHDRLTALKASGIITETRADAKAAGEPYPRGGVSGVLLLHLAYRYGGRLTVKAPSASQIVHSARVSVASRRHGAEVGHTAGACTDSWTGGNGDWSTAANWSSDAVPGANDNVCITSPGTYTVSLANGGQDSDTVNSLSIGGSSGTQTLDVHGINGSGDTLLTATHGITTTANGAILLDCVATQGGSGQCQGGLVTLAVGAGASLVNAGTITTTAANRTQLEGDITNTGTIAIDDATATFAEQTSGTPVTLDNQGTITLASGAVLSTAQTVTNDTGGTIAATGSGTLDDSGTFNAGAGTTSGSVPVTLTGDAALNATGSGASSFDMYEGGNFTLSGTLASAQSLLIVGVNGTGDTHVTAAPGFTNSGSIIVECEPTPGGSGACSGGIVSLGASAGTLTNRGTLTTTAANAAQLLGNLTNTGTLSIQDATASFGEYTSGTPVTLDNEGTITVADGAELATSQTVTNDTGGSIEATGSGTLNDSGTFNEGAGITSGTLPVTLTGNATLNLTGSGASSIEMYEGGSYSLSGTLASAQSLLVEGVNGTGDTQVTAAANFTNHGAITLACVSTPGGSSPCSGGVVALGASSGSLVNDGRLTATAANDAELTGDLTNAGTLAIGTQSLPSTLTVTGDYTQDADGVLAIPITGTASGDFSVLQINGSPTLAGTLSLEPSNDYAASPPPVGTSAEVLAYSGTLTGTFAATTVSPESTAPPVISGTPVLGDRLSCSTGTFTDSPASYAYQWNRDGAPISGATASTYTVVGADVGQSLSCTVTAASGAPLDNGEGFSASYSTAQQVDAVVASTYTPGTGSATSGAVAVTAPPANVAAPTITGTAKVGDGLSCSEGTWLYGPTGFAYAWYRNGSAISGATGATYTVTNADAGQPLNCSVTASNASGSATSTSGLVDVAVPLTLTPGTLPTAVGANPYAEALTACGGSLPFCEHYSTSTQTLVNPSGAAVSAAASATFALRAGALPPGLALSAAGLLSGAPTQSGSFPVTLTVTDPAGTTAAVAYDLTVSPGIYVVRTDGTFSLGGAIPAGSVTISPNSSGAISSVSMSSGGNAYVPVTGATGAETAFGLQLSGSGSSCRTSLKIAGPSGVALSASGLLTSGCAGGSTSVRRAQLTPTRPAWAVALDRRTPDRAEVAPEARGVRSPLTSGVVEVQSVASNGVAGSLIGIGSVSGDGTFTLTIDPSATGPIQVKVNGGSYSSELDGATQQAGLVIGSVVASAPSLPTVLPIVPLINFIDSFIGSQSSGGTTVLNRPTSGSSLLNAYGFPTGSTAEAVVPNFTAAVGGNAEAATSILADLEAEAASLGGSDRGALVNALSQEIADGVFNGAQSGSPLPFGSGSLPASAGTSVFLTELPTFATTQSTTVPPLAPLASTITPALPVAPVPVIPAAITRIGPQAFTETLTADPPATGRSPFSASSDAFDIEVVG